MIDKKIFLSSDDSFFKMKFSNVQKLAFSVQNIEA